MKKNLLIAFCGMDGSGKTTLAKKLKNYLEKGGRSVFFKHAHGYAISQNSFAISEKNIGRSRWLFVFLSPYVLIDSWLTYLFRYRSILKSKTLICDRYFYDKIARQLYYQTIPPVLAKLYLRLLPEPDYVFILDVDEQSALTRKPEYTKEELARFRKIYLFVARYLKISIINTQQSLKTSLQRIINQIDL